MILQASLEEGQSRMRLGRTLDTLVRPMSRLALVVHRGFPNAYVQFPLIVVVKNVGNFLLKMPPCPHERHAPDR